MFNPGHIKKERRKHPRLSRNLPLKITTHEDFDIVTQTQNLSCSGAYCEVDRFLPVMTKLKIVLLLPFSKSKRLATEKINCQGVVVRTEPNPIQPTHYNIAIFFNDIQKRDMQKITNYINSYIK